MKSAFLSLLVAAAAAQGVAYAGTLAGTVTQDHRPVPGAMVTAFSEGQRRRDTVYTDADGRFTLSIDFAGKLSLRARAPYFKDSTTEVDLAADGKRTVDFALEPHSVAAELSASLPASTHLSALSWQSRDSRQAFISQCNYCHQVGNALTQGPRDQATWKKTVRRMEGYLAMLTDAEVEDITKTLAQGFDGKPVAAPPVPAYQPELAHAAVKEWVVGDAMSFIHDTDVGADDHLYGSDEGHDIIWRLDRKTGRVDEFKLPDSDLPEGGVFSGLQLPIGVFTGKHGPHSMAQGKDGRFWITNALSSTLMSFDPATRQFKVYDVGRTHLYPHTVRIDGEGIVWFTLAVSNEVARFDPKTEEFTIISLPRSGFWSGVTDCLLPYVLKIASWFPKRNMPLALSAHKWAEQGHDVVAMPYGIDVSPLDGSVWYAKLNAHKIGRIDRKTLEVTEFDTPFKGPRRLRFDREGTLWIPAFEDSGLMRFDTRLMRFETFRLPLLAHNEYEVPYALNVHPVTGDVWVTSNMSDRMFRFDPATKTFVTYPMPTRVTWLRDLVFAKDGGICSSSSNLPAYGIEGGLASFVCLYPDAVKAPPAKPQSADAGRKPAAPTRFARS